MLVLLILLRTFSSGARASSFYWLDGAVGCDTESLALIERDSVWSIGMERKPL